MINSKELDKGLNVSKVNRTPLVVAGVTFVGFVVALLAWPGSLNNKLMLLTSGTCAQRVAHSYFMSDLQLPVEGRMVGIFGGYALTLFFLWFIGRGRAFHLPHRPIVIVLILMVASMAIDGLNATVFDMGLPVLYQPQNWLRLLTGLLSGIGLAGLVQPFFNSVIWQRGYNLRSFQSWGELGAMLVLAAMFGLATISGWELLYWPVAIITVIGIVTALVMINLMIFALALRRENRVISVTGLLTPLSMVFIFSLAELILFAVFRIALVGSPVQAQ